MAGKQRFTPAEVARALTEAYGLMSVAAQILGCDTETVRNYANRYASVRAVVDEARVRVVDLAERRLIDAIDRGEPWAVALVVKTLGKNRGYVEGQPVDVRAQAERLAREHGFDTDEVIREAERIVGSR